MVRIIPIIAPIPFDASALDVSTFCTWSNANALHTERLNVQAIVIAAERNLPNLLLFFTVVFVFIVLNPP
jgi:hypothetical protein